MRFFEKLVVAYFFWATLYVSAVLSHYELRTNIWNTIQLRSGGDINFDCWRK